MPFGQLVLIGLDTLGLLAIVGEGMFKHDAFQTAKKKRKERKALAWQWEWMEHST